MVVRIAKSLAIFIALSSLGAGVVGFASADDSLTPVPVPGPGDSAQYTVRDVVEDEELARGSIQFDWVRLTWLDEMQIQDISGNTVWAHPLRFELAFAQATENPRSWVSITYYDPATGHPIMESNVYGYQVAAGNGPLGLMPVPVDSSEATSRVYRGPLGLCGVRTPVQGADEPPAVLDVSGECRFYGVMGWDDTTQYTLQGQTSWDGHRGVEYQDERGRSLIYTDESAFPAVIDVGLEPYLAESYRVARHFRLELDLLEDSPDVYPVREPLPDQDPVALTERMPRIHIDDASQSGLTLAQAYQVAMADTAGPRLAEFMEHPDAYLATAWKHHRVDGDGRVYEEWHLAATIGQETLGKVVKEQTSNGWLPDPLPSDADQYVVEEPTWSLPYPFPHISRLPDQIPDLAASMERARSYEGVENVNTWGFYVDCVTPGCSQPLFSLRVGEEYLSSDNPSLGTQGYPWVQNNVFFAQDGLTSHTWHMEGDGRPGLLPGEAPQHTPREASTGQGVATWNAPAAETVAGLSFLALVVAAFYHFWPAIKIGGAGLFSRIKDSEVLDHPERQRIHDVIKAQPGIHLQKLTRTVGLGTTSLEHHLAKLADARLVVRHDGTGYTCFFLKGAVDRRDMEMFEQVCNPTARKIVAEIARTSGESSATLATRLGISRASMSYHVSKLRTAGILSPSRSLDFTPAGQVVSARLQH